jgi:hypothetical protein
MTMYASKYQPKMIVFCDRFHETIVISVYDSFFSKVISLVHCFLLLWSTNHKVGLLLTQRASLKRASKSAILIHILGSESKILLPFLRPECTAVNRPECIAVNRPECFACMMLYKCSCFGVFCTHCVVCWFLACLYTIYTEFAYWKQFLTLGQLYFCICVLRLILFSLFLHHLALSTI